MEIVRVKVSEHIDWFVKKKDFTRGKIKRIEAIERHGKFLKFFLNDDLVFVSHLGMTGAWVLSDKPLKDKHNHLTLVGKNKVLNYIDPRRFGRMYWLKKENLAEAMKTIGVDISSADFTLEHVETTLKKYPNRQIKVFLLDQRYFAGSGNYIANEICAHAGIRPTRRAGKITKVEVKKLFLATRKVVEGSIKSRGVTFQGGYQDAEGNKGEGVANLVVFYQKVCQLCQETPVKKIILAARGTYYCPKCQK